MLENKLILTFNTESDSTYRIAIPHIKNLQDVSNIDTVTNKIIRFMLDNCVTTKGEGLTRCKKAVFHDAAKASVVESDINVYEE